MKGFFQRIIRRNYYTRTKQQLFLIKIYVTVISPMAIIPVVNSLNDITGTTFIHRLSSRSFSLFSISFNRFITTSMIFNHTEQLGSTVALLQSLFPRSGLIKIFANAISYAYFIPVESYKGICARVCNFNRCTETTTADPK